ncbi:hypothetical protein Clacol_002599 [Clathrus columnatus]|uniref:Uncharacterized protein n=1 Tax=Clathrus columnatus TaxID=1419009 RepID=A0AAV5A194_9AGAM|nr:hypothetical protein Clacol_002599 [Clathrus columnatus]
MSITFQDTKATQNVIINGITGGFKPPTPSEVHLISKEEDKLLVSSQIRPDGTPKLLPEPPKELAAEEHKAKVEELEAILKSLPVESPPGVQDIYGLDTSIAYSNGEWQWMNGGPNGTGTGESTVQPTEEQKAAFQKAVALIREIVA